MDTTWVEANDKSRLTVREYNVFSTAEFYAATSNPLTQNMIDTIAVKHGWPTATLDGKRAYLQVPETKDVVVKPPKDWCTQPDYKPRTR